MNHHKAYLDQHFCIAIIRNLEAIASILGTYQLSLLSQDYKARVSISVVATNKQAPLLMYIDYSVSLLDHDWAVAKQYKLIQNVNAWLNENPRFPKVIINAIKLFQECNLDVLIIFTNVSGRSTFNRMK